MEASTAALVERAFRGYLATPERDDYCGGFRVCHAPDLGWVVEETHGPGYWLASMERGAIVFERGGQIGGVA